MTQRLQDRVSCLVADESFPACSDPAAETTNASNRISAATQYIRCCGESSTWFCVQSMSARRQADALPNTLALHEGFPRELEDVLQVKMGAEKAVMPA